MPWVGFELMIPVFERAKTVHDLDRAATVIGKTCNYEIYKLVKIWKRTCIPNDETEMDMDHFMCSASYVVS
jgi:hypothetical protein